MATAGDKKGAANGSVSFKKTAIELLIVSVLAAGIGASLMSMPGSRPKDVSKKEASEAPASTNVVDLPPIVTNLGSPTDVWIRFEASAVLDGKPAPHAETVVAEIAADILAYLRTTTVAQLEGPIGLQNIRQDINERAIVRSKGAVAEIVIRTLVVQ